MTDERERVADEIACMPAYARDCGVCLFCHAARLLRESVERERASQERERLASLAPAAVCRVASWIVRLRKMASEDPVLNAKIGHVLGPLPFERELLSGRMEQVEAAIAKLGASVTPEQRSS